MKHSKEKQTSESEVSNLYSENYLLYILELFIELFSNRSTGLKSYFVISLGLEGLVRESEAQGI